VGASLTKSKCFRASSSLVIALAMAFGFGVIGSNSAAGSPLSGPAESATAGSGDIDAIWTVPSSPVAGQNSVSVRVTDNVDSAIKRIDLADDGDLISSTYADGRTNPVVADSEVFLSTGTHDLTATVTLLDSRTYVLHRSVTAREKLRIDLGGSTYPVGGSTTAVWGDRLSFTARVTANTVARAGLHVTLQSRPAGSTVWTTRAVATTNDDGDVAFPDKTSRIGNASWRVLSAATARQFAGTTNAVRVPVLAKVGRSPRSATLRVGQKKTYVLHVHPWDPGAKVRLWRVDPTRSSGVRTLAIGTVTHRGLVRLAVTLHHAGRYNLGAIRIGTSRIHRTGFFPGWNLTVTN
jgi:hypothetical protein